MNPLARALALSAVLMFVLAIVLAVAVGPVWGGVAALVGLTDLVMAGLFRSGVLGTGIAADDEPGDEGDEEASYGTLADGTPIREDDNPLARED